MLRLLVSTLLLATSICVVLYGIVSGEGSLLDKGGELTIEEKALNALILIFAFFTLFLNEGFQVAAMRVKDLKASDLNKHHRAKKCHSLLFPVVDGNQESNMPRLFIGQSFLVVLCTFLLAKLTRYENKLHILNDSEIAAHVLSSPLIGIVFTVSLAQLLPSLLAKNYPIQFLQLPCVCFLINVALLIESSGIVNCTYVIVEVVDKFVYSRNSNAEVSNNDIAKVKVSNIARCKHILSATLTISCIGFVLFSICAGYSTFEINIAAVQLFLLLTGMFIVFYCEGLKIAIVCKHEEITSFDVNAPTSSNAIVKTLSTSNNSIERYLLGRQQTVVPIGFLIAQINHFYIPSLSKNLPQFVYFMLTGASPQSCFSITLVYNKYNVIHTFFVKRLRFPCSYSHACIFSINASTSSCRSC